MLLVETFDGVAIKRALEFEQRAGTVNGFTSEPSLQDLEQLASMNSADITRYIEQHAMVTYNSNHIEGYGINALHGWLQTKAG